MKAHTTEFSAEGGGRTVLTAFGISQPEFEKFFPQPNSSSGPTCTTGPGRLAQDLIREEGVDTILWPFHPKSLHPRSSFEPVASQDIANSRLPVNKQQFHVDIAASLGLSSSASFLGVEKVQLSTRSHRPSTLVCKFELVMHSDQMYCCASISAALSSSCSARRTSSKRASKSSGRSRRFSAP